MLIMTRYPHYDTLHIQRKSIKHDIVHRRLKSQRTKVCNKKYTDYITDEKELQAFDKYEDRVSHPNLTSQMAFTSNDPPEIEITPIDLGYTIEGGLLPDYLRAIYQANALIDHQYAKPSN